MRKRLVGAIVLLLCIGIGVGGIWLAVRDTGEKIDKNSKKPENTGALSTPGESLKPQHSETPVVTPTETPAVTEPVSKSLIDPKGKTLETRILTPEGYTRTTEATDSLGVFLRTYELKEDQSKVLLYDGSLKVNQAAHASIFRLPLENRDLQQCADSVIRVYAEFYWKQKAYDKISFHFTNGFLAEYSKWVAGYRIKVDGNHVSWVKSASYDDSYETFVEYLKTVFCYAGTMSLEQESEAISLKDIQIGDIFIKGGSPGHVVMIVDICENESGEKAFLLAQGYMPAQEFHVLKNPIYEEDPWYYEGEVSYPFFTPQYTFEKGSLRHPKY